jgi:SAM-dependent methyltransferase
MTFLRGELAVAGCDVSYEMLRHAPAGAPVAQQEPFALPFADNTFDVVYAFCIYHHIDVADHARHFAELVRVARPGGHVFVFEHNPLNPVTQTIFRRAPIDQGYHMILPWRLHRTFIDASLDAVRTNYVLFFPERVAKPLAAVEDAIRGLPLGGQYFSVGMKRGR